MKRERAIELAVTVLTVLVMAVVLHGTLRTYWLAIFLPATALYYVLRFYSDKRR